MGELGSGAVVVLGSRAVVVVVRVGNVEEGDASVLGS